MDTIFALKIYLAWEIIIHLIGVGMNLQKENKRAAFISVIFVCLQLFFIFNI